MVAVMGRWQARSENLTRAGGRYFGPQPHARAVVEPQTVKRLVNSRGLQPLTAPGCGSRAKSLAIRRNCGSKLAHQAVVGKFEIQPG